MPKLAQLCDDHIESRDSFEVIAIHDSSVASFDELDQQMAKLDDGNEWNSLPFPVAVDDSNQTETRYGVSGRPAYVLIDPEGNVVGDQVNQLVKQLPNVPASRSLAKYLDAEQWGDWNSTTMAEALQFLKREFKQDVSLDSQVALDGLGADLVIPLFVFSGRMTLRSLVQMMFRPMGLAISASDDDASLVIQRKPPTAEPLSDAQAASHRELRSRLTQGEVGQSVSSLEIEAIPLEAAIERIARHFELPMGIEGTLRDDLQTPVTGHIRGEALEQTLLEMLKPIGLVLAFEYELVMVKKP